MSVSRSTGRLANILLPPRCAFARNDILQASDPHPLAAHGVASAMAPAKIPPHALASIHSAMWSASSFQSGSFKTSWKAPTRSSHLLSVLAARS